MRIMNKKLIIKRLLLAVGIFGTFTGVLVGVSWVLINVTWVVPVVCTTFLAAVVFLLSWGLAKEFLKKP